MTLLEAFRTGSQFLKSADIDAPAIDAGVLLCSIAKCSREELYTYGDREMEESLHQRYLNALEKRSKGYPLQYLTGMQEFMSLSFYVGPGVLIPRQETELLVETVLEFCRNKTGICTSEANNGNLKASQCSRILDMGTGSGCIAISLAYYLPGCTVVAVDKMESALDMVKRNARANGVEARVSTLQSDLFRNLEITTSSAGRFDVIVSNPPYIRSADICDLQREVREHEPIEALDGGIDGLSFYRQIIGEAQAYLKEGGMLAFEVGYDQAKDVAALMSGVSGMSDKFGVSSESDVSDKFGVSSESDASDKSGASNASGTTDIEKHQCAGFRSIRIHKDLAGIDRVVTGVKT